MKLRDKAASACGAPEKVEAFPGAEDALGQSLGYKGGAHAVLQAIALPPHFSVARCAPAGAC